MYEAQLERYRNLLNSEYRWITQAMSWSVVTRSDGSKPTAEDVARQLGGELAERDPAYEPDEGECLWSLIPTHDAVGLLEVNGFQASRPEVLRRLSQGPVRVHSVYWNIENDNAFSYATAGDIVTVFDGEIPDERHGSSPDALEDQRAPLWAAAEPHEWPEAMLALVELRTGVPLDLSWFDRPHLSVLAPELPDQQPPSRPADDVWERLRHSSGPRRDASLAELAQTLVDAFGLGAESTIIDRIAAQHAAAPINDSTQRKIFALRDRLHYEGIGRFTSANPDWRRSQAGWAIALALCPFLAPSREPPHTPTTTYMVDDALKLAKNALGDAWPCALRQIGRHL
ncbi:DUF6461 domain-containing protein [Actinoplanes sp. NPDC051633]|uniref:DUF6461 domain-containing protein n=1 Tax=Actinoplanes sp. NPDC051633 TaxID=3155670 RepID=UPI0034327204